MTNPVTAAQACPSELPAVLASEGKTSERTTQVTGPGPSPYIKKYPMTAANETNGQEALSEMASRSKHPNMAKYDRVRVF